MYACVTDPQESSLETLSAAVRTDVEHDNTGVITLNDLAPESPYDYHVEISGTSPSPVNTFRTLPRADEYRNAEHNPKGLFNFAFEFGCGNNQRHADALNVPLKNLRHLKSGRRKTK